MSPAYWKVNEEGLIIANKGRSSISKYCIFECEAKCCKKGALLLQSEEEIHAVIGNKKNIYLKKKYLEVTRSGNYTLNYAKAGQCSKLDKNNLCTIYKNLNRPKICGDFPLFVFKNYFSLADNFCPAAKLGLLDEYTLKLENLGFKRI